MANTVRECDRMLEAAEKSGKKLAVGHVQRFFNSTQKIKEYVDNKTLGKLCMVSERRTTAYFTESRPKWLLQKDKSGGIIMNYGAHALDKLFYMTGARASFVSAFCGNAKTNDSVEGYAQILFGLDNGCSANVTFCGYLSPLLSNIMLNELDRELESRGLKFTRYADDCVIVVDNCQLV